MRNLVFIETPRMTEGKIAGSRASIGRGTTIVLESGEAIPEVKSVDVHIAANEAITARIHLNAAFKGEALATFFVRDPRTGEDKAVTSITFEDGSIWSSIPTS